MEELKPLDIAHQFCKCLLEECTGTRFELAEKLGITPAWVTVYKRKLEYLHNVEIEYCRKKKTYLVINGDKASLNYFI